MAEAGEIAATSPGPRQVAERRETVNKMLEAEIEKLAKMEEGLKTRVKGQDEAVTTL